MENKFKNKNKKTIQSNTIEAKHHLPPHPNCRMSWMDLKKMSYLLPNAKLRRKFVQETYTHGLDPDEVMTRMLSDPEVQSLLDDMALTGSAPRIPAKFRVRKPRKPDGPSQASRNVPPQGGQRPPGRAGPDDHTFEQQCQRLISNMSNMGGMMPLAMPGLGIDGIGCEETFSGQHEFDGRRSEQGQRDSSGGDPSMASISELQGIDGPLKQEYERLLNNVTKIGGFNNIGLPSQSPPGPSSGPQKRKCIPDQHSEPKRSRLANDRGPPGPGPNRSKQNPPRRPDRPEGRPMNRPNMPPQNPQRSVPERVVRGNVPEHGGNTPFNYIPPGNQPQFNDEFRGDMPPFGNRPQGNMQPGDNGPRGNMPPFNDGPHGNMGPFNNGPQGNMPPFNNVPQGGVPPFNNGPQGSVPPFNTGPQGNMPPFNNGPQGNMPPFNNVPQGNVPPFNNRPQGNMAQFNHVPHGNMTPFNSNMPLLNNGPQCNIPPFNNMPNSNMVQFSAPPSNSNPFNSGNGAPYNSEFCGDMPSFRQDQIPHPDMPQRQQPMSQLRCDDRDMHLGMSREPSRLSDHHLEQRHQPSTNDFRVPEAADPKPSNWTASKGDVSRTEGDPRAPLFIVPIRYPSERFTDKQMDAIENSILDAILEIDDERLKPTFQDSFRSDGRYGVICNDQLSKNWLFGYLSKCRPWPYAVFKIISAQSTKIKADALLPLCKNDDNDKILKFIAKQNTKLNVSQWEVVQRMDGVCNTSLTLVIDEASADVLKGNSKINFKMGRAEIVVASKSGSGGDSKLEETLKMFKEKHEREYEMSQRSRGSHSELLSEQTLRGMPEPGVTVRDPGSERGNFDPPAPSRSRRTALLPTPRSMMSVATKVRDGEYSSNYEPSRSDRFFRTPSPEPRSPGARDPSRQDDRTALPYRPPTSGGLIQRDRDRPIPVRDSSPKPRKEPFQRSSVQSKRIPTIDGNSSRDRPSWDNPSSRKQYQPPSGNNRPPFPQRR